MEQGTLQERCDAIIVDGAFKTLMIAKWTPEKFLKAYQEHHNLNRPDSQRGAS